MKDKIDKFLEYIGETRSSNTLRCYRNDLSQFSAFMDQNEHLCEDMDILIDEYRKWLMDGRFSGGTAKRKMAVFRSFLSYIGEDNDMTIGRPKPISSKPVEKYSYLEREDVERILYYLRSEFHESESEYRKMHILRTLVSCELILHFGFRVGQTISVKIPNVMLNQSEGYIVLGNCRYILQGNLVEDIRSLISLNKLLYNTNWLLCGKDGGQLSEPSLLRSMKKYISEIVPCLDEVVTPSTLRNTHFHLLLHSKEIPDIMNLYMQAGDKGWTIATRLRIESFRSTGNAFDLKEGGEHHDRNTDS